MSFDAHYDPEACALVLGPAGSEPFQAWDAAHHVFVIASLQDPGGWPELIGRQPAFAPALAYGFRRAVLEIEGAHVPLMLEADDPQRTLAGTVFLGLSLEELERVEALQLAGGLRRRIELEVTVGERRVDAVGYVKRD
ncbi:MAG: hypothetical protein P8Y05_03000 [Deinococcales bacterium]